MILYKEDWLIKLVLQTKGSVAKRAFLFAVPCACLSFVLVFSDDLYPNWRENCGLKDLDKGQLWSATTFTLAALLTFRTTRAMARFWEGTGLLHQMRGEWFDSISCCVTFSSLCTRKDDVLKFRHTIVRLMSLCHGSALEEIAGDSGEEVEAIDPFGLDSHTLEHLNMCKQELDFNRVEVLLHMIQTLITTSLDKGILHIPPPILSRVYQTLSRGFVNLLNAKKIADTRFPFPYAQLIAMLLFAHVVITPLLITALIRSYIWAPFFTFIPIFAMYSVNFIGVELENPFGKDDNDLPLFHFQGDMNKCLMMLLHSSADHVASISPKRCIMNYNLLAMTVEQDGKILQTGATCESQRLSLFSRGRHSSSSDFGSQKSADTSAEGRTRMHVKSIFRSGVVIQTDADDEEKDTTEIITDVRRISSEVSLHQTHGALQTNGSTPLHAHGTALATPAQTRDAQEKAIAAQMASDQMLDGQEKTVSSSDVEAPTTVFSKKDDVSAVISCGGAEASALFGNGFFLQDTSFHELSRLVEKQVQSLSESINGLQEFSSALPSVIDSMLVTRGQPSELSESIRAVREFCKALPMVLESVLGPGAHPHQPEDSLHPSWVNGDPNSLATVQPVPTPPGGLILDHEPVNSQLSSKLPPSGLSPRIRRRDKNLPPLADRLPFSCCHSVER